MIVGMEPPVSSMGPRFIHASPAARLVFGAGRIGELASELDQLDVRRVLFACTPGGRNRYSAVIDALGTRCAAVFAGAEPHCPEPVAAAAAAAFEESGADGVVTIGGGSTIGLGKFVAARTGRPLLAVPTTLSGSEMTALYGVKIGQEKCTFVDVVAKPRAVIYDADLFASLPRHETATTGMNCLAHCVEALYPAQPNPIASLIALEGIRTLARSLPCVIEHNDAAARADALYAGFIGGLLVSMVGIGLHHKICHVLGGHFGVPHGETNSVLLPHVVAFNAAAMPDMARAIGAAMGVADAAIGIFELGARIGTPRSLHELGLPRDALAAVAQEVVSRGTHNPRPITADGILRLLDDAWHGRRPQPLGSRDDNEERGNDHLAGGKHVARAASRH
jgi:alcohol dehydrogenase class IV